jgi:ABC-2 type transport system permease protein
MRKLLTLVRRELWEHTTLVMIPVALLIIVLLANLTLVFTSNHLPGAAGTASSLGIFSGAKYIQYLVSLDDNQQALFVNGTMITIGMIINTVVLIMMFFYLLDSLYGERKDHSILFWKSLPVTNRLTVISKLTVAIFIIPVIIFTTAILADLITLAMQSYAMYLNGMPAAILWQRSDLVGLWMLSIFHLIQQAVWYFPVMGWLLFCSAWSRKKPIIIAVLLPALLVFIDSSFLLGTGISESILERLPIGLRSLQMGNEHNLMSYNISNGGSQPGFNMLSGIKLPGMQDIFGFILEIKVWSGILAGLVFTTLAILMRRLRDDSV